MRRDYSRELAERERETAPVEERIEVPCRRTETGQQLLTMHWERA